MVAALKPQASAAEVHGQLGDFPELKRGDCLLQAASSEAQNPQLLNPKGLGFRV